MKIIKMTIGMLLVAMIVQGQGIRFEQGLSWDQVKAKAKAENKYIFLDIYATWCGPCREMEQKVYPDEKVGDYMNTHFISVKVQYDTSKQDNDQVKSWYAGAHQLIAQYKVTSFPTYLFFSPDGEIVHRDLGYKAVDDFMKLIANAGDPGKQYYTLLRKYKQGDKDYTIMPYLANTASETNDRKLAKSIAGDYITGYLDQLKEEEFFTKKNITFLSTFPYTLTSKDNAFQFIYHQPDRTDKLLEQKWAGRLISYIITKEEIDPQLWKDKQPISDHPDWKRIIAAVTRKYGRSYAARTVLDAQIGWYDGRKDWPMDIKYNIEKIEKYGVDTTGWGLFGLNNMVFSLIFQYSTNKTDLEKGMEWMQIILKKNPNDYTSMDTYANLLYKAGRTGEALAVEEKALKLDGVDAIKQKRKPDPVFRETVDRMAKGEPTWGQSYNQ